MNMSDNEEKKVVSISGVRESKEKDQVKQSDKNSESKKEPVYCSFCERPNHMVIKMIEGPGVNICSECTMICLQYFMLSDRIPTDEAKRVLEAFWNISKRSQ